MKRKSTNASRLKVSKPDLFVALALTPLYALETKMSVEYSLKFIRLYYHYCIRCEGKLYKAFNSLIAEFETPQVDAICVCQRLISIVTHIPLMSMTEITTSPVRLLVRNVL